MGYNKITQEGIKFFSKNIETLVDLKKLTLIFEKNTINEISFLCDSIKKFTKIEYLFLNVSKFLAKNKVLGSH